MLSPENTAGDYDYHQSQHMSSGPGYSSYHPTTGSGYGAHPPPPVHPPVHAPAHPPEPVYYESKPSMTSGKNKKSKSTLTALTLLSFFFFVNLLQNCLKEHMDAMNPTVMVMTVNGVRNRFNKLAEMNSREQNAAAAAAASQADPHILVEPADLLTAAASSYNVPNIALQQSPYSGAATHKLGTTHNNNNNNNNNSNYVANKHHNYNPNNNDQNQQHKANHQHSNSQPSMRPEFYDSVHLYPNRSYSTLSAYSHQSLQPTKTSAANVFSSYTRSTTSADNFYSPDVYGRPLSQAHGWSSASSPAPLHWSAFYQHVDELDDVGDRRYIDDSYYTRIN